MTVRIARLASAILKALKHWYIDAIAMFWRAPSIYSREVDILKPRKYGCCHAAPKFMWSESVYWSALNILNALKHWYTDAIAMFWRAASIYSREEDILKPRKYVCRTQVYVVGKCLLASIRYSESS